MSNSRILSMLEIACPVRCEKEDCGLCDKILNTVLIPMNEEASFFEAFGHGGEDADIDNCDFCDELGTLGDPYAFFFYSAYIPDKPYTMALRMSLDFIEALTRLVKNHQEDQMNHEKVFLAADGMCNFFDDFRVFEDAFKEDEFDFEKPDFVERNKVAIVGKQGVLLSIDISTKGDNETELGNVRTCWFSLEDLATLNGWIVERVGTKR